MRVIQKLGVSPQGGRALLYRRAAERLIVQEADGSAICEITADSWRQLIEAIRNAPKRWFVVTDSSTPAVFDQRQVIYDLAHVHLRQPNGDRVPSGALPAIAPILLNEGTLSFYQGSVAHDRLPQPQSVARVYLWRDEP